MMDGGDDVGMVLSPQCFHNLNQHGDIFNHQNIHFWEYMQPGYDALGFISCTGAHVLACGWTHICRLVATTAKPLRAGVSTKHQQVPADSKGRLSVASARADLPYCRHGELAHDSRRSAIVGTNFLIRSSAFNECGWMPEYTLTEDYALGMELKMRKWQVLRRAADFIVSAVHNSTLVHAGAPTWIVCVTCCQ